MTSSALSNAELAQLLAGTDASLKRKSQSVAERQPVKVNHVEISNATNAIDATLMPESPGDELGASKKPGRRPIEADLPSNASNSEKRRAQNRAAQRAFRERKERYVKELEDRIQELESQATGTPDNDAATQLRHENDQLRALVKRLAEENRALQESKFTFEVPLSTVRTPPQDGSFSSTDLLAGGTPLSPAKSLSETSQEAATAALAAGAIASHQLRTPPECSLDDCRGEDATTGANQLEASLVLQQVLDAAAAAQPPTPNLGQLTSEAALAALVSATTAPLPANAAVAATPNSTATPAFTRDSLSPETSSASSALAFQELFGAQLFPPLGSGAASDHASPSPSMPPAADFASALAALTNAGAVPDQTANALTGATPFSSYDTSNPIFSQYRDTNALATLLSEPVAAPLPGANGQPLDLETVHSDASLPPSTTIMPLENLPGLEQPSFSNHRQLEEYCAAGVLKEADLDLLCMEMKKKCRAAKEAAVAKLERLKEEHAEQEKRTAHAIFMSSQLDNINMTQGPQ
ncbi:hypothetical protein THASP1DRAFT_29556 [Thamnocephalis sphaerospora]|uniref:BZIP domain-containing protein n=1 Tax=Thamnocephalis sphaerospora TaxID=78915 RepID=A0A4P9XT85_9FUNG|nr:hypothetical protein THASP1DRAFT_29556 [Thamnocephalis sphaerospora]|eukprot:RKP08640.1 hypothetical protein THASP1DRAFT_29556 [Thamnocephalis sphaerospora]